METITDAVSVHSIKKAEYARRMTTGALGNVTLMDYFVQVSTCTDGSRRLNRALPADCTCHDTRPMGILTLVDSQRHKETSSSR